MSRLQYLRRVLGAYVVPGESQLTFWHDLPEINPRISVSEIGEYYMPFFEKADYRGFHDADGIPMLDYHGQIGRRHNPIAIAQWGLGNYNLLRRTGDQQRRKKFLAAADWLCTKLEPNLFGVPVWNHLFDWEYRTRLIAPWYSGLAQGQGISLLVRAFTETKDRKYLETAENAFRSFRNQTHEGGICFTDNFGDIWFEEYIVAPPTHILNGFIWATWGVYDLFLVTGDVFAKALFASAIDTLRKNLHHYDLGFWSLYEQSGTRLPMVASPFYHRLHIVQLRILARMTGEEVFAKAADKWEGYTQSRSKRTRAVCLKSAFKLCYY
jgi:heparosan-N-sulfate-glucuronate 5-epimerase